MFDLSDTDFNVNNDRIANPKMMPLILGEFNRKNKKNLAPQKIQECINMCKLARYLYQNDN